MASLSYLCLVVFDGLIRRGLGPALRGVLVISFLLPSVKGVKGEDAVELERGEKKTSETRDPAEDLVTLPSFQNLRYQEDWSVLEKACPEVDMRGSSSYR